MPDTEIPIPIAGARPREDAQSPAPRRPSRNRGPGSVKIAGHVSQAVHRELRMLGATQGRTVQSLPGEAFNELFRKHRAAAYRRGVGLGPRTRRPGADTPCAVVPPSSRIPGRRPVLFNRILAPARLRLRCDAACAPPTRTRPYPGALFGPAGNAPPGAHRAGLPPPLRALATRSAAALPCIARLPKGRLPPLLHSAVWSAGQARVGICFKTKRTPTPRAGRPAGLHLPGRGGKTPGTAGGVPTPGGPLCRGIGNAQILRCPGPELYQLSRPEPCTPGYPASTTFSFRGVQDIYPNAAALPDGRIYLMTGMLAHVEKEAQLAMVLGHERSAT